MNPIGSSPYVNHKPVSSKNNPAEIKKKENKKVIKEFKQSASALENKYYYGSLSFQGHKVDLLKAVGQKYLNAIRTISQNEKFFDKDTTNKNLKEITKEIDRICNLSPRIRNSRFNTNKFMLRIASCNDRLIKDESITNKGATAEFFFDEDDNYKGIFKECDEKLENYVEHEKETARRSEQYWKQQDINAEKRNAGRTALYEITNSAAYAAKEEARRNGDTGHY